MCWLMEARLSRATSLVTRKPVFALYRTLTFNRFSFIRLYRAAECAVGSNVLLLHYYGSLVFRRLNQIYRSIPLTFHKDSRLFVTQKILLGGCLISFAQDKISDDEFTSTVKSFLANPEVLSGISPDSQCASPSDLSSDSPTTAPLQKTPNPVQLHTETVDFTNPPLTITVRQLRNRILNLADGILRSHFPGNEDVKPAHSAPTSLADACSRKVDVYFSSLLPKLELQPSGNGFIDDSWELVINKPDLRLWRRLLPEHEQVLKNVNFEVSGASRKSAAKYEYRLCGTFRDISALSFLEVQLNLAYRRLWDHRVVTLEYIDSNDEHCEIGTGTCDNIRWITKFPFPFARREYVYVRRWWLEPVDIRLQDENDPCLITNRSTQCGETSYGRYAVVFSRSSISPSDDSPINRSLSEWTKRLKQQTPILVSAYRSALLIEAHLQFDEPGMNYYLVYYDDPRFSVSDPTLGFAVGKAMDQFIEQLHDAALNLSRHGLPANIEAVVFPRRTSETTKSTTALSTPASSRSAADSDPTLTAQLKSKNYPESQLLDYAS